MVHSLRVQSVKVAEGMTGHTVSRVRKEGGSRGAGKGEDWMVGGCWYPDSIFYCSPRAPGDAAGCI